MKTQVFVLVPRTVTPDTIDEYVRRLLEPHRCDPDERRGAGRFDYLVGAMTQSFDDPAAEARLPPDLRDAYAGNVCDRANLPDLVPGALVTPDGAWHDLADFGWRMADGDNASNRAAFDRWSKRYHDLIAAHDAGWVVEVWAHS